MNVHLTYIPATFWTRPEVGFKLLSKGHSPPTDSAFFIMWCPPPLEQSESFLHAQIIRAFSEIPVEKLLTCQIRLVVPKQENLNKMSNVESNGFFPVISIIGKIIPIPPAIKLLYRLKVITDPDRTRIVQNYSESVKTWAYLTKLTMELLSRGNFLPILDPRPGVENEYEGRWRILLKTQRDHQRFKNILRNCPWIAYNLPINLIPIKTNSKLNSTDDILDNTYGTNGLWHPSTVFVDYMDTMADLLIRNALSKDYYQRFRQIYGIEKSDDLSQIGSIGDSNNLEDQFSCKLDDDSPWDLRFLYACISKERENRIFRIKKFCDTPIPGILQNWIQHAHGFSFDLGVSFTFRLEYPKTKDSDWMLKFYIQPLQNPEKFFPLGDVWNGMVTTQEDFAHACDDTSALQEELLRALGSATRLYPPLDRALDGKNPTHVNLNSSEVMDFMRYSMYLLIQNGYNVILPDEFSAKGQQRLSAQMIIKPMTSENQKTKRGSGMTPAPLFDLNSLLEYRWEARLEDKSLTETEFRTLANAREPLIYWRNHWILVDPQDMESLRPIFEKPLGTTNEMGTHGTISYSEALKLGMIGKVGFQDLGSSFDVRLEGDFSNIIERLSHIDNFPAIEPPSIFHGTLRPYQQKGLTWLTHMSSFNFGIILADDMGLGKTIQVIAYLLYRKSIAPTAPGSTLIICPTSVIFNWQRELQKFGPDLEVKLHYGPDRVKDIKEVQELMIPHRIILTSYGMIRNDIEFLETVMFSGIIVDESQNIKNVKTQQTQAIYKLKGQYRICLSGTPIENRLLELWSLFEFLNPGLLGSRKDFQTQFILPIERFHDEDIISKLRKFISPFILRRLKSDKSIIQDLPAKNEIKVYLQLTSIQAQLYQKTVQETMQQIENIESSTLRRRGLILKLLMQLKQICNHPYQFLHLPIKSFNPETQLPEDVEDIFPESSPQTKEIITKLDSFIEESAKVERLLEMVEEVLENGQKLLIFTQFKQMGDLLQKVFESKYKFPVLFLHGQVPEKKRREMVDEFQSPEPDSPPIMLLSLKAGGLGLNLTQASTVFHFDRWWNPAVENQATDRAYRIGQIQQVNVYKFITNGTIEEKIDVILEEKRSLADLIVVTGGETWITQLSNEELRELFSLGKMGGGK